MAIYSLPNATAARGARYTGDRGTLLWPIGVCVGAVAIAALLIRMGSPLSAIAWFLLIIAIALTVYQPRYGVYILLGGAMAGDPALMPWYPFYKNFSSVESILYLNRSVIFSPLEMFLVLTFITWVARRFSVRSIRTVYGPLFWPLTFFTVFAGYGLLYGLSRGGVVNTALWESRAIFCLPLYVFLVTNLITSREHIRILLTIYALAIGFKGIVGALFVANELQFNISSVERIAAHSYSIQINAVILLAVIALLYRVSGAQRTLFLLMIPCVLLGYVANQRRAAYIALTFAFILFAAVMFFHYRKVFWLVVPIVSVALVAYLIAFWNAGGALGFPARALRSVIAPDTVNLRDQSSNMYRLMENTNIMFTIKTAPVLGVGFGNKFYIIVPMADISVFELWEYITHNSVMWIWMKAGLGGFLSLMYMILTTASTGARLIWKLPKDILGLAAVFGTLCAVMQFIYAYVDMSWESQGMIYFGLMLGFINSVEQIAATEPAVEALPAAQSPTYLARAPWRSRERVAVV